MAAVETTGKASATASSRAGQTAPKRYLLGQAEAVQQLEHAAFLVPYAETVFDQPAEILRCPAADAVALGIRTSQNHGAEHGKLAIIKKGRPTRARPILPPRNAFGVEANYPVVTVDPRLLGGPLAAHAVQRIGDCQKPTGHPPIGFKPRRAP